jgi:glycosyltransferase involved in cell wall biosynthesis
MNYRAIKRYKSFHSDVAKNTVSIVICCYNHGHWLSEAIESALNQTYKNVEVIVVNDGSTDNTSEVAKQYPIKLIEKENGGLASARNAGINIATGYYILPLDGDDKLSPIYIEKTIGVDDIVPVMVQLFGDYEEGWCPPIEHPALSDFMEGNHMVSCTLYKREIWEKIGGYDECELIRNGFEDWDFWIRATKAGYTVSLVKEYLFYYRKHGYSMIHNAVSRSEELKNYILGKHK